MLEVQLIALISTLGLAVIATAIGSRKNKFKSDNQKNNRTDYTNSRYYLIAILSIAMFYTLFRAKNVGIDYSAYLDITNAFMAVDISKLNDVPGVYMEYGLVLLIKICSYAKSELIPFIFITTLVVLYAYYKEIKRHSKMVWLSMFLLFGFGSFFTIFNTTAQYFVCALSFLASTLLYQRKFWRYSLAILAIALFHKSAIIMIPAYFLLTYRVKRDMKTYILTCIGIASIMLSFVFFNEIVNLATLTIYPEYESLIGNFSGLSYLIMARPIFILSFLFVNRRHINYANPRVSVWMNATVMFLLLSLLSIKLSLLQRFNYFFLPYTILLIPDVISRINSRRLRYINIGIILIVIFSYTITTCLIDPLNYNFIWDIF